MMSIAWTGPVAHAQAPATPPKPVTEAKPDIEPEANRWRLLEPGGVATKPRNPLYDPYSPNLLKGDYPLVGDRLFLATTATLDAFADFKRNLDFTNRIKNVPFHEHNLVGQLTGTVAMELFKGATVFAPKDWAIRLTPIMRFRCGDKNAIDQGCGEDFRIQEAFGEVKLFEVGQTFDATSLRAGLQGFASDFFGLVYNDVQPGARVFSELERNRFKVNVAVFDRLNKEKLSGLNEFKRREHQVGVVSFQWDDFLWPGFNVQPSFVVNHDDKLGRPLDAYYMGVAATGLLGPVNVNGAVYYVTGATADNTPDRRRQTIQAGAAFAQFLYPVSFVTPRLAIAYATGDRDPTDRHANGFDSVFDNVAFGGGQFSYLFGEKIQLGNTTVLRGNSIFPSLRGANATSQFVNPGAVAINAGMDFFLTPKLLAEANLNYVRFDDTSSLERALGRDAIGHQVGYELNSGLTYRPFLNEQVILFFGGAVFFPGQAIKDTFGTEKAVYKTIARLVLVF